MSALLLLPTGDLDLSKGGFQLTDGKQQVLQNVRSAIRAFQGEWFLDLTVGLPYFQTILQKGTSQDVIEGLYKQAIANTDGILEVTSLSLVINRQARTGVLTFTARTVAGNVTSTETI